MEKTSERRKLDHVSRQRHLVLQYFPERFPFHHVLLRAECAIRDADVGLECGQVLLSKIRSFEEGTRETLLQLSNVVRNEVMQPPGENRRLARGGPGDRAWHFGVRATNPDFRRSTLRIQERFKA